MEWWWEKDDKLFRIVDDYTGRIDSLRKEMQAKIDAYLKSKDFPFPDCVLSRREQHKSDNTREAYDSVKMFLEECAVEKNNAEVANSEFYQKLEQWLDENGCATIPKGTVTKIFNPTCVGKKVYIGFELKKRNKVVRSREVEECEHDCYILDPVEATEGNAIELKLFLEDMRDVGFAFARRHHAVFRPFNAQLETLSNAKLFVLIGDSDGTEICREARNGKGKCGFCEETRDCTNEVIINGVHYPLGNVCLDMARKVTAFFDHLRSMIENLDTCDLKQGYEMMDELMTNILLANNKNRSEKRLRIREVSEEEEEEEEDEIEDDSFVVPDDYEE